MILFHNYSHVISPWAGENEFTYSLQHIQSFFLFISANPFDIIRLLFAFFGHYGVQLFIFISGYGLFLSYSNESFKWDFFLKRHLIKIYPCFILAVCTYFVYQLLIYKNAPSFHDVQIAIIDLLFLQNFIPHLAFRLVGPWWFFSLIVQFYAIFPFLVKWYQRFGIKVILAIGILSLILTIILNPWLINHGYNLYFLFIGRLPVFCLGIYFAYLSDFKIPWWVILGSFILLVWGNLNGFIWHFTMLAVTIVLLVITLFIIPYLLKFRFLKFFINWIGINSLFIFAIHGFLRWPIVDKVMEIKNPLVTITMAIIYLLISLIVAFIIKTIEHPLRKYITKYLIHRDGRRIKNVES